MAESAIIAICNRYIQSVALDYPLFKAYLFGSFAKDTPRPDSDIDLAIILKTMDNPFRTQLELMKRRREFDLRLEPHSISEEDFIASDPFVKEILDSGIEISF